VPRPRGGILLREEIGQQPRLRQRHGKEISKMRSRLSMRGTIRRWWRLARTEAAVSPMSARAFSAFKAEASRS
jgi:hypothetical protein